MKLKNNAPVTITFSLICAAVLAIDLYFMPGIITSLFTAEGSLTFRMDSIPSYIRIFTHIFGHADWNHLLGNITMILLLGPILEEKYGSKNLIWMIFITALVNGLVNGLFFTSDLLGASGVLFMMILLASFANIKEGEIPITFILVFALYLLKEIIKIYQEDQI
nr:rhomboid family intramembrane serine protease [Spirochaetaceae bacterium]